MAASLEQLTAGGRTPPAGTAGMPCAKPTDDTPRTLVGSGGFMGPPDAAGTGRNNYSIAADWRGQGLATELVAGLVQQAADTGMVRQLVAHTDADNQPRSRCCCATALSRLARPRRPPAL